MSMDIPPVYVPPPPPPPPPKPVAASAPAPASAVVPGLGGDRLGLPDDPFAAPFADGPLGTFDAPAAGPAVPANGSRLVAIPEERAFVAQAFLEMFGHPVVTPEELAAAKADPGSEHSKNVLWRHSLVEDNLAHLQGYMKNGQDPASARRTLIEGLMQTDEFKQHAGVRANQLDLGLPITLTGPDGAPIPFLWHSQATFQSRGDKAFYYGDDGLPLDRPVGFDEANRFLENFFCNGTSAYAMAQTALATTPQAKALAALGQDLYDAYWGRKDGDDPGRWRAFLAQKQAAITDLVAAHPELAPQAAETQAVLGAGLAHFEKVKDGGQAPFLQSVPGAKTGFYLTEPKGLNPRGPVDERVVPDDGVTPRYAQIGNFYARQTYAQQHDDPNSPVGAWIASWRA